MLAALAGCLSLPERLYYKALQKDGNCLNVALETCSLCYERGYRDLWVLVGPPLGRDEHTMTFHINIEVDGDFIPIFNLSVPFPLFKFLYKPGVSFKTQPGAYVITVGKRKTIVYMGYDGARGWHVTRVEGNATEVVVPHYRSAFLHSSRQAGQPFAHGQWSQNR